MRKLLYVEENFITPDECQKFIDFSKANKKEKVKKSAQKKAKAAGERQKPSAVSKPQETGDPRYFDLDD